MKEFQKRVGSSEGERGRVRGGILLGARVGGGLGSGRGKYVLAPRVSVCVFKLIILMNDYIHFFLQLCVTKNRVKLFFYSFPIREKYCVS